MTTASRVRGLRALWVAATTHSHHTTARRLARTHLPAATLRRAIHRPTVLAASAFRASAGTRAGGTDTARTSSTPSPPSRSFASTPPRMTASIDVLLARRASDHWRCHARRVSASTTLHPRHPHRPSLVRSLRLCCMVATRVWLEMPHGYALGWVLGGQHHLPFPLKNGTSSS